MSGQTSLESLQALRGDLVALFEHRLSNLQRLGVQLEEHIQDFRTLLDKKARNQQSRDKLKTGNIDIGGQAFAVSEDFQRFTIEVADDLDLDELSAAELVLDAQDDSQISGQSLPTYSIARFHLRREAVLDCIRLTLQLADGDEDPEDYNKDVLQQFVARIVQPEAGSKTFSQRCLSSMSDIKQGLQILADKVTKEALVGPGTDSEKWTCLDYQRVSLVKQHEALGVILLRLVKLRHVAVGDIDLILNVMRDMDKFDNLLFHYFPALSGYLSRFGGQEGPSSIEDARALDSKIISLTTAEEGKTLKLPYIQAAIRVWWLAEYGSWYDNYEGPLSANQIAIELRDRALLFSQALKQGAFDVFLSLSADVKSSEWYDPARHGLRKWLQRNAPFLGPDSLPFSDSFQEALMEQLEAFVEAFITNLPDVLRKLRVEEDEQRQKNAAHEHDLDLERFLLTISYAFAGRPKAAFDGFWDVPDGALMGFMYWASRRASTPLVSAFCEMLQALAEDEECATAAHQFLLDEGSQASGKMRRPHSLTWNQIFKELTFFAAKIRDRLSAPQPQTSGRQVRDHEELEPESWLMLECYLRLIARLCTTSTTARLFLATHTSFNLMDLLFQLTSSAIEPRLKACAFTTLRSFLSHKSQDTGEQVWTALDNWISGTYAPGYPLGKSTVSPPLSISAASGDRILKNLANGFEEPDALVKLLRALVLPYDGERGLNDGLPFPESLGASSRLAGIDPYVDFAVGQIFGIQTFELNDIIQVRLLQLSCLDFIAVCLDTFNEDLVVFANQSNVTVDQAIRASSLKAYVLLHPFARVMEWMFNDKVVHALFTTVKQNTLDIAKAQPDSPLMLCLLRGIHVLTMILDLQATFLDIVLPEVKMQSSQRRAPISKAAFASFEDCILNNLSVIADLALYCTTGHAELTAVSLKLLEKISASPRLASATSTGFGRGATRNKTIAALEGNGDAEVVSRSFIQQLRAPVDLNLGPDDPVHIIKLRILDFLHACLMASPDQPNIAHLLFGFECQNTTVDIAPSGLFSQGISLFHSMLSLALTGLDTYDVSSWHVSLKCRAFQILSKLWQSPLTSNLVVAEMRENQATFTMLVTNTLIHPQTLWDGRNLNDPELLLSTSAQCLSDFLFQRANILQYISTELRQVSLSRLPSLKSRIFSSLQGLTTDETGTTVENPTIFDLFDFIELEFHSPNQPPRPQWFLHVNLHSCITPNDDGILLHNIDKVRELLILRHSQLAKENSSDLPKDAAQIESEIDAFVTFCHTENQVKIFWAVRLKLLQSWVQLLLLMIETANFDNATKTAFILRTLQTILPSLENRLDNGLESLELAKLARSLIFKVDFNSDSFGQGDMANLVGDRLYHLFQVSLRAIVSLGSNPALKEIFYSISIRYLSGMSEVTRFAGFQRRHSTQTIKVAGDRFVDMVCDDAYNGEPMCRISALLLLDALVQLADYDNSNYITESLARLNFIGLLVDAIQSYPLDLGLTAREDVPLQLSYCHARLALLLRVSKTRSGAATVLNAGLLQAIKASRLFQIDPDLGVDIDDADPAGRYYQLLASILRVVCSAIVSRGFQNEQVLEQGRNFLHENKLSILNVFKKQAGLSKVTPASEEPISDLADSYLLLISATNYLDAEDTTAKPRVKVFT